MIETVQDLIDALQAQSVAGLGLATLRVVVLGVTQKKVASVLQVVEAGENKIILYTEE